MSVDQAGLANIAGDCVSLTQSEFGATLDWSVASLATLDAVCAALRDGPSFAGERFDLWWKLVGAYTGEVVIRLYGGRWIEHELAPGSYAVEVAGVVGFPFGTADRVLRGEPFKSLASFARSIPAIAARRSSAAHD